MSVFEQQYAQAYDLLYQDKPYQAEVDYVESLATQYHPTPINRWLDIGCGTGRHAALITKKGIATTGVDPSNSMIAVAKQQEGSGLSFDCATSTDFHYDQSFDVISALFHVFNYHCKQDQVEAFVANVAQHLNSGGCFIFDFWYGPAVLLDPPTVRVKEVANEVYQLIRHSQPHMDYQNNIVTVNFTTHIFDKAKGQLITEYEQHPMRYYFLPELQALLQRHGLVCQAQYQWLTDNALTQANWYGVIVATKP